MKQRQAVVLNQDYKVEVQSEPIAAPAPNQILCRTSRSLISAGTELGKISGSFHWTAVPCLLGYSNASVIEEVGSAVEGFAPGQRLYSQGPHASHFLLDDPASSRWVPCLLPDEVSDDQAIFITHAAVSWYGVRKARLQPCEKVLILGDGIVGVIAAQLARHSADAEVFFAGHHDFRLEKAAAFGCSTVNSTREDLLEFAQSQTDGKGFSVVINTAGVEASLLDSIAACATHGRVIQLGTISENVTLPTWDLERKEVSIIPAFQPLDPRDIQLQARKLMIELLKDDKIKVDDLLTQRFDFSRVQQAYATLNERDRALGVAFIYD